MEGKLKVLFLLWTSWIPYQLLLFLSSSRHLNWHRFWHRKARQVNGRDINLGVNPLYLTEHSSLKTLLDINVYWLLVSYVLLTSLFRLMESSSGTSNDCCLCMRLNVLCLLVLFGMEQDRLFDFTKLQLRTKKNISPNLFGPTGIEPV